MTFVIGLNTKYKYDIPLNQEKENKSKDMIFRHFQESYVINMVKNYWILQKKGIFAAKTDSRRVVLR